MARGAICLFSVYSVDNMKFGDLHASLISSKGGITVRAAVLHILETVDTEGNAEAGPEHGEAERARGRPGHYAGPTVCCGSHSCLKTDVRLKWGICQKENCCT